MALNYTLTQYALILDVDLLPSFSAYGHLRQLVHLLRVQQTQTQTRSAKSESGGGGGGRVRGAASAGAGAMGAANESSDHTDMRGRSGRGREQDYLNSLVDACAPPESSSPSLCVFVLAAFESVGPQEESEFVRNKSDLCAQVEARRVTVFKGVVWAPGHAPTNYTQWYNASRAYRVAWAEDYEPYVMVRVKEIRREHLARDATQFEIPGAQLLFDTRFVGFGFNKATFIQELHLTGYLPPPQFPYSHEKYTDEYAIPEPWA